MENSSKNSDLELKKCLEQWHQSNGQSWSENDYQKVVELLLRHGELLLGYDICQQGLQHHRMDLRLQQLLALALIRLDFKQQALSVLSPLLAAGVNDAETLGLIARIYKAWWLQDQAKDALDSAIAYYQQAFEATQSYWNGINYATLLLSAGKHAQSQQVACQVIMVIATAARDEKDHYWREATLGEAYLLLGLKQKAKYHYQRACQCQPLLAADLHSTRQQAKYIIDWLGDTDTNLSAWFASNQVVVFSGHMIDDPQQKIPRFPAAREAIVKQALKQQLQPLQSGPLLGYASAACGGDILFLESILELGGSVTIVLPCQRSDFARLSVEVAGKTWVNRYHRVLQNATRVIEISKFPITWSDIGFEYANRVLLGLASIEAQRLGATLSGLALWDNKVMPNRGGTSAMIADWQAMPIAFNTLHPASLQMTHHAPTLSNTMNSQVDMPLSLVLDDDTVQGEGIVALLFADIEHFSRLDEEQSYKLLQRLFKLLAHNLQKQRPRPIVRNSWGDGLFLAFHTLQQAAEIAKLLQQQFEQLPWEQLQMEPMRIRIALHAGPIRWGWDPIAQKRTAWGTHVSFTARMEPIVDNPGLIFVSEAFAALYRLEHNAGICRYLGKYALPKKYGSCSIYALAAA